MYYNRKTFTRGPESTPTLLKLFSTTHTSENVCHLSSFPLCTRVGVCTPISDGPFPSRPYQTGREENQYIYRTRRVGPRVSYNDHGSHSVPMDFTVTTSNRRPLPLSSRPRLGSRNFPVSTRTSCMTEEIPGLE